LASPKTLGDASPAAGTRFSLEAIDEIDDVIEPAAGTRSDATASDGDRQMGLAGAGSADQDGVALLGDESAAGEVFNERFVDRRAAEFEASEILCKRQLDDGELVLDGARLLLISYGSRGLMVVDASIMPFVPSAPTNLTTIMIAEHVARHCLVPCSAKAPAKRRIAS
jgi:hypothetical protein